LACLTILKAQKLKIKIRTESELWTMFGYSIKIQEIVDAHLWKKGAVRVNEAGLMYLNQLLDTRGEKLITWQQLKSFQGQSSKGKKAEWFKAIEAKVLSSSASREVQKHFRTGGQNTQAMQVKWEHMSEDRRRKEWIVYGTPNHRQLGKVVRKKKKKILIEHWQMQSKEEDLATEINRCKGCIRKEEQIENNCQQWIRVNRNINMIPDALIKKGSNQIRISVDQITNKTETNELKIEEQKFKSLRIIEELEIEIIKRQKLEENTSQEIIEVLRRNIIRNKNKYIIYTDGAANMKASEELAPKTNMVIGWVQTDEMQEWSEEEMAFGLEGWQTSTIAELVAIWTAILTIPKEK